MTPQTAPPSSSRRLPSPESKHLDSFFHNPEQTEAMQHELDDMAKSFSTRRKTPPLGGPGWNSLEPLPYKYASKVIKNLVKEDPKNPAKTFYEPVRKPRNALFAPQFQVKRQVQSSQPARLVPASQALQQRPTQILRPVLANILAMRAPVIFATVQRQRVEKRNAYRQEQATRFGKSSLRVDSAGHYTMQKWAPQDAPTPNVTIDVSGCAGTASDELVYSRANWDQPWETWFSEIDESCIESYQRQNLRAHWAGGVTDLARALPNETYKARSRYPHGIFWRDSAAAECSDFSSCKPDNQGICGERSSTQISCMLMHSLVNGQL